MAIRLEDEYTNSTPADADYPEGSFKNESLAGLLDGTPFEKAWANDIYGFLQKLLDAANISPSGAPDTVLASDYYTALTALFKNLSFRTVTVSGAIAITDVIIFADATAGDVVLSTPSAAAMVINGVSIEITVKRKDTSVNKVVVEDIQGEDWDLTGNGKPFLKFVSDGTTKYLVG